MLDAWTIDDASRFADHLLAIVGGLVLLGLVVFLLKAPGNAWRFREYQAQKAAEARTTATRLGFQALGGDPARPLWGQALDLVTDGNLKVGPFPSFAGSSRVKLLFEGNRDGFAVTVLVQSFSQGDGPETPDSITTMACFASPDLTLPAFTLKPAHRLPALGEAAFSVIAKVLRPLVRPGFPPDEEIDFDDPAFWPVYSVRAAVPSLTEGLATHDIREVFTPAARAFLITRPGWSVEALSGRFLIYRDDVEETQERMPAFLDEGLGIAQVFRPPARLA